MKRNTNVNVKVPLTEFLSRQMPHGGRTLEAEAKPSRTIPKFWSRGQWAVTSLGAYLSGSYFLGSQSLPQKRALSKHRTLPHTICEMQLAWDHHTSVWSYWFVNKTGLIFWHCIKQLLGHLKEIGTNRKYRERMRALFPVITVNSLAVFFVDYGIKLLLTSFSRINRSHCTP